MASQPQAEPATHKLAFNCAPQQDAWTPLLLAAGFGYPELVKELPLRKTDATAVCGTSLGALSFMSYHTPLVLGVFCGRLYAPVSYGRWEQEVGPTIMEGQL